MKSRAAVIDFEGYFSGIIEWGVNDLVPNLNAEKSNKEDFLTLIMDANAIETAAPKAKWDKKAKAWQFPTEIFHLVNGRGEYRSSSQEWPDRLPEVPPNHLFVKDDLPSKYSRRPIWNFEAEEWQAPRVVAVIKDDVIVSAGLENPNEIVENLDDVTPSEISTVYPWPQRADGSDAQIHDRLIDGEWNDSRAEKEAALAVDPRLHVLGRDQFYWLFDVSGLDDVRDTVLATLKASDRAAYAGFKKSLRLQAFTFDGVLETVAQIDALGLLPEDEDFSETRLGELWLAAKDQ